MAGPLRDLPAERIAVLLVDFQNDFCVTPPGRKTNTTANARTAKRANRFAAEAAELGMRLIYTRQVLDPARLTERQRRSAANDTLCVAGSVGAELFVTPMGGARVISKYRFDVWQAPELQDTLDEWGIEGLVIAGVELRCCVLYAVLGAEERGYAYSVPLDLVSGVDDDPAVLSVKDYLSLVHGAIETSDGLLDPWRV